MIDIENKIEIALLDDHSIITSLLQEHFYTLEFVKGVAVYNDAYDFVQRIPELHYDVIILDIMMPKISGHVVLEHCKKSNSLNTSKIIFLSSVIEPIVIKNLINNGANGFVSKTDDLQYMNEAISTLISSTKSHPVYLSPAIEDVLLTFSLNNDTFLQLTPKEKKIMVLICQGRTVKEMAFETNVSVSAIQQVMKSLFKKFEVNRTPDFILKVIQLGYYIPSPLDDY